MYPFGAWYTYQEVLKTQESYKMVFLPPTNKNKF